MSALNDGRLVVFAGAGVSMGPPSNLPSFLELARRVSSDALDPPTDEQPLDRYLGIAESLGVNVQLRTREIIDDSASRPTSLHHDLLALFASANQTRVITTNFDRHFTTAGRERFGDHLNIYYAPALPLGREFQGLVYLHGAVEHPSHPLVITDGDFGRAYLTDGWATRMLMDVFERYAVLFVGYSHNDPVMNYLARGLVPGTARYALTTPGDQTRWKHLGITPIALPWRPDPDKYGALPAAISAWAERANLGSLAHEERIRTLVQSAPPVEQDLADYLEAALRHPTTVRFFTAHARGPEWLRWAEDKGAFTPLFREVLSDSEVDQHIAIWFADHYAIEHPAEALAVIGRQGLNLGWTLWNVVTREIGLRDVRPEASVASAWAVILVRSARPGWARAYMGHWLSACQSPEERMTATVLFRHLTRIHLTFDRIAAAFDTVEDSTIRVPVEIHLEGEVYHLRKAWEAFFAPHLDDLACELIPMLGDRIREAHHYLQATGAASDAWDPLSYRRSAIEPHPQDRFPEDFDFVIDVARDTIEWVIRNTPERADSIVREWSAADAPLLKRLALHGLIESPHLDADAALNWVMERGWLYASGLKHEVFRLLEHAYPTAHNAARERLIRHSMEGPISTGRATDEDARGIRDYERYNVAVWLSRADPDCVLAARHLGQLQEAHPEFGPRDFPDLSSWMGDMEAVEPQSPVSDGDLLAKNPTEWVELLTTYEGGTDWRGPTREGLLVNLRSAVRQSASWGWELANALEEREEWRDDLWSGIIEGWKAGSLDAAEWERVLALIEGHPRVEPLGRAVMDLLEHGLETEAIPLGSLAAVERLGDRLFGVAAEVPEPEIGEDRDWLTVAINHLGGDVAQVWVLALARRRGAEGAEWDGLPESYESRLQRVLSEDSHAGRLGRVILAARTAFLYNIDAEWTRAYLLPLFDWTADPEQAQQAWHGYLYLGQWNDALVAEMLSLYTQCFPRLEGDLSSMRERFCRRLASIAFHSTIHPIESGWLPLFIREAGPLGRGQWASAVTGELGRRSPAEKQAVWTRWLSEYWTQRITGVPRPFEQEEIAQLPDWVLKLGPVFPDAVEKLRATTTPLDENGVMFFVLRESELAIAHPTAMAKYAHHLLSSSDALRYDCGYADELVRRLINTDADREVLLAICEELARLGCRTAAELKAAILR